MSTSPRTARWPHCQVTPLLVLLSFLWMPLSALSATAQIIISADEANSPIDRTLLRAMFSMRLREWPDGRPVHVFVLSDEDEVTAVFCREQLGTYPYVMRSTWDRLVFTGTGLAPTLVRSEREMRERVRSTPGAIGYVRSGDTSEVRTSLPRLLVAALTGYPHG